MKSLIRRRREAGAVCPICRSPDYRIEPPHFKGGKPNIFCNSCKTSWQYGVTAGMYKELEK